MLIRSFRSIYDKISFMPERENPLDSQRVKEYVEELVGNIAGPSSSEGFSNLARFAKDRIRDGRLIIAESDVPMVSVTSFDLLKKKGSGRSTYVPHIIVDEEKLVLGTTRNTADIVRTLAVAAQYPSGGFELRLRDVYRYAMKVQADWLDKTFTDDVPLEPRTEDPEPLIRKLLGDAKYYSDVGFDDWQNTIDNYHAQFGQSIGVIIRLGQLREDKIAFINKRNEIGGLILGHNYSGLDVDQRARETANRMIMSFLHSGVKLN